MKAHANTVGINEKPVTKDIYIIKNRINGKVYIGQSVNAGERFIGHCKKSSADSGSLISKAIQKYGANNFWYEVLESQIPNYNEREKYWIAKYNSVQPNGYNIQSGGEEPPVYFSIDHPKSTFSCLEEIEAIKTDLRNTNMSLSEIASKYGTSKRTVMRINQGLHYEKLGETYPIRKQPHLNGKLSDDQISEIIEILRTTYRQYEDIAKQYGISISAVKQINSGDCHPLKGVQYPIRAYKNSGKPACTFAQVTEINDLLMHTQISCNQIAKCYGIDLQTVYIINNGNAKRYRRDGLSYPLRERSRHH